MAQPDPPPSEPQSSWPQSSKTRRRNLPAYLGLGAAAVLIAGLTYTCSTKHSADQLSDQQAGITPASTTNAAAVSEDPRTPADPARRCASGPTYALIKQELFRRAAQIRGRDDVLFDRIAASAALRVERPVVKSRDEGLGSIACSASATIDLPPGLAVAGGRTNLSADLDYTLQAAADGSGDVVALANADAITIPLATLGRSAAIVTPAPGGTMPQPDIPRGVPSPPPLAEPAPPAPSLQIAPPPLPPAATARIADPSFPCARARTRGEIAICGDPGLAAIDRRMAAQYRAAYAAADPDRRDILRSTAHRFYGFRDNCPTARCIADGYRERMREIDEIMRSDDLAPR